MTATDASGQVSVPSTPSGFSITARPRPRAGLPTRRADEESGGRRLDWAPVRGAKSYALQVATNDGFETGDLITDIKGINGTSYSPPKGYDNDQYYWRVRAVDAAGSPSAWSVSPHNFKRHWPDRPWPITPVQPGFPAYPADFDTSDPAHRDHPFYRDYVKNHDPEDLPIATLDDLQPFLQWTPVQHASHYELQLSTNVGFVPTATSTCLIAGTTFTPTNVSFPTPKLDHKCQVKQGTRYFWRVRPMDRPYTSAGIQGIYSPIQKFVWQTSWFSDVKPAQGATVTTPTFSWRARAATAEFRVNVRNATGRTVASGTTRANSWTPSDELIPSEGPFSWDLTGITADGTSTLIYGRSFNLAAMPADASGLPPLTALSARVTDAATMRAPQMSWTPHPLAARYSVDFGLADLTSWLVPAAGEMFGEPLFYPTLTDTGTRIMAPGRYRWRVNAWDAEGRHIASSATYVTKIADFEEVTGQTIALDGAKLASGGGCDLPMDLVSNVSTCPEVPTTPVLRWEPQEDVSFYAVYVSYDQNFTNLTEKNSIPASMGTMYAYDLLTLPDNTSGVPYYWHIRPCKAVNVCAPDPVSAATGMAKHAFKKVSPRVETEPTDEVVTSTEVNFRWRDYHDTNQSHLVTRDGAPSWTATYRPDLADATGPLNPSDLSNQSALRYRIRIAKDPLFTQMLENEVVDQASYTSTSELYPRVQCTGRSPRSTSTTTS
ncbi:hypothetical protein [Nocardioides daphniae]|uniref:Fibronectin type III domain-containing protein n=1 Tax=Nocardioides daphniae TaxID=402297 RepID=A0A4P7UA80_9ACTN|nr:hypothetical protein [Nocardioides daphniae]QCC76970.1 hypothetical protein E2C04_06620 [Nocardioides daphniae]